VANEGCYFHIDTIDISYYIYTEITHEAMFIQFYTHLGYSDQ